MALIIAFANHKGGVAKTTSVGALGTLLAHSGLRVLMVDLDTQANLTYSFIDMQSHPPGRYVYDAIRERKNLPQVAVKDRLYVVPSGLEMTLVEAEMEHMRRREYILEDLVAPVEDKYDIILLDCPPALNIVTLNALVIADRLTVPMNTDQLSYYGLKMMKAYVESLSDLNPELRIDDVFFTKYNASTRLARRWEQTIREEFPEETMVSVIRQNVKVQEAVSELRSVVDYAPESNGARDYVQFAAEYAERLNNR